MEGMRIERNEEIAKILKAMEGAGFDVLSIRSNDVEIGSGPKVGQSFLRKGSIYHLTIGIDKGTAVNPLAGVRTEKATSG